MFRKGIATFIINLNKSKVVIVFYTLQFAASINLTTTMVFEKLDIYIKIGLLLCALFLIISSWFLIVFENKISFIERVSNQKNDNYSKYRSRIMGKADELAYPLFSGLSFTIYSIIIIVKLILNV